MAESEPFGENPFRRLAADSFPARAAPSGTLPEKHARANSSRDADEAASHEDDDAGLFFQAVRRLEKWNDGRRHDGDNFNAGMRQLLRAGENVSGEGRTGKPVRCNPPKAEDDVAPAAPDDADAAAFLKAMSEVRPLQTNGREVAPQVRPHAVPPQARSGLEDFLDGKLEFSLSFSDEYFEGHVVGLDQMTMNKLRAGSLSPEAHIDLHGLNVAQAFETLRGFMRACWYKSLRTVLIVPGRGRNSPNGIGVLREKLQNWLTQEPFKRVVLAFCTAQPHDGGAGGVYVLLRKYRKKGRIFWERMPADVDLL